MKRKVRFLLKNTKAVSSTAINMIYAWGYKNKNGVYKSLKYSTKQSVDPKNWDPEIQRATGQYSSGINNELEVIKATADNLYLKLKDEELTPSMFKAELDIKLGRNKGSEISRTKKTFVYDFITRYVNEIESGERRTLRDPLKLMSPGTIKNFKSFKSKFGDYEKETGKSFTFDDINMGFYKPFIEWLGNMHTVNSAGKIIKQLKTIMQAALDDGLHSNIEFKKNTFKVTSELVDTVYLTEEEIHKLYLKTNLAPQYELARDYFLIGCFTLQRVSDWDKINKDNIDVTPNGTRVMKITQQKTGAHVVIPLVSPRLIAILEKYDYKPPRLPDQKINDYIKIVCKDPADHEGDHTSLHIKSNKISTHTARRSGSTNMYRAGIPMSKIMRLSGHKTELEFRKYIRVTDDETAEELAGYEYFNK